MPHPEIEFAQGQPFSETQRMRLTYKNLNGLHPTERYPVIHKTWGDESVTEMGLTPDEGKWLAAVLTRMFNE